MSHRTLLSLALLLASSTSASAQEPASRPVDRIDSPVPVGLIGDLRVPLHTRPADTTAGEYGIWAVGRDYKASFHDGFCFYPLVGSEREHRPWHWHTESVAAGDDELARGPGTTSHTDWRLQRRWADVVEAYDIRSDGVEQTFAFPRRPRASGDLVVTGRVSTSLSAPAVDAAQQTLEFEDGDQVLVRYGRAVAIDATGRRIPVTTRFDGVRIELRLGEELVKAATFPVVIDPLTTAVPLQPSQSQPYGIAVAVTAQTSPTNPKVLVAYSRRASASDSDAFALTADLDYSNPTVVYSDVTARWSSHSPAACYVGGSDQWVLAFVREIQGANGRIFVYIDQATGTTLNGGTTLGVPRTTGAVHRAPHLGGSRHAQRALLVFTEQYPTVAVPRGVRVDASAGQLQPQFGFQGSRGEVAENPRVTPLAHTSTPWLVSLQSTLIGGGQIIRVARVPYAVSGTAATTTLLTLPTGATFTSINNGAPVAGSQERYLLVYGRHTTPSSCALRSVRFDWPDNAAQPTIVRERTIATQQPCNLSLAFPHLDVAYDYGTRSHWAVSFNGTVMRLGYSGAMTETQSIQTPIPRVAFARPNYQGVFQVAHTGMGIVPELLGQQFQYPSDAISAIYGTSCASGVTSSTNRSYAGHEFYRVNLNGLQPQTWAFYVLGFTPGSQDLTPQGLPGCFLNIGLPAFATWLVQANITGQATVVYGLPDAPLILGDVFSQWFYVSPGANPVNLLGYHGVRHQIR